MDPLVNTESYPGRSVEPGKPEKRGKPAAPGKRVRDVKHVRPGKRGEPGHPGGSGDHGGRGHGQIHVGVVHGPEGVYFVTAAPSREAMFATLGHRLVEEVHMQLWDEDAARFRALLDAGELEAAVGFYFSQVGQRWDPARLSLHTISM